MTIIVPNYAVTDIRQSPNRYDGRNRAIDRIIIHHWGNDGQNHDTVAAYLCRANGRSSAHYVASAGRVTQIVSDRDTAWHCPGANSNGIGIECRPEMSPGDFEQVAILIAAIRSEHGDLPLGVHRDYVATACPGRWASQLSALDARARQIAGGATPNVNANADTPAEPWRLDTDGIWGPATGSRFREVFAMGADTAWEDVCRRFQYALSWQLDAYRLKAATGEDRIKVDGVDGPVTWGAFQAWYNYSGIPEGSRIDVDRIYGPETIKAVQITLNNSWANSRGLAVRP